MYAMLLDRAGSSVPCSYTRNDEDWLSPPRLASAVRLITPQELTTGSRQSARMEASAGKWSVVDPLTKRIVETIWSCNTTSMILIAHEKARMTTTLVTAAVSSGVIRVRVREEARRREVSRGRGVGLLKE